jgi:hypothetical protein
VTDVEIERELIALGAALDVAVDDFLVTRVRAAIAQPPSRLRRRIVIALAAALIAGTGVVAVPVVADWLGVGGVEIKLEPPPSSVPSSGDLNLGQRTTLTRARRDVRFDLVVPTELGAPDEVWIDKSHTVPIVWFAYRPRPGLPEAKATGYGALLAQAEVTVAEEMFASKLARPDTKIEQVEVGTGRALWVQGTHHVGLFERDRMVIIDELRLSDNVLLWERGSVTMRLESALGRDDSLRIARSVR